MNIEYLRDVSHCEPTTYASEVTIKTIEPANNSDNLIVLKFEESGWQVIANKDNKYNIGDKVFFIPPDSVLPLELSDKMNITKYLNKSKIQCVKLRGNRSEGIIVDMNIVEPYLPYIMKWEDLPDMNMKGDRLNSKEIPYEFVKFYKMPNLLNEPFIFNNGDNIYVSEKIHGTNARFGFFINPLTNEYQLYVGSHNMVFKVDDENNKNNVYISTIKNTLNKINNNIPKNVEFFGEIYGSNIQGGFNYGLTKPNIRIFATYSNNRYMTIDETIKICNECGLETVPFHKTVFESVDKVKELSMVNSEITNEHIREGIVLRLVDDGGVMAKVISPDYLSKKNRTEKH